MPTYEYLCACGERFDAVKQMAERHVAKCPECGSDALVVFSPKKVGVHLPAGFRSWDENSISQSDVNDY